MPIGIVIRRSSVAVVRSRSVVIDVTMNMIANGKTASSAGAAALNACSVLNTNRRRTISSDGTSTIIATVRWSWRSWVRMRRAVASANVTFMRVSPVGGRA